MVAWTHRQALGRLLRQTLGRLLPNNRHCLPRTYAGRERPHMPASLSLERVGRAGDCFVPRNNGFGNNPFVRTTPFVLPLSYYFHRSASKGVFLSCCLSIIYSYMCLHLSTRCKRSLTSWNLYKIVKQFYRSVKPKYRSVKQFYRFVKPKYRSVKPFYRSVKPKYRSVKLFYACVNPFYRSVKRKYRSVNPFYRSVKPKYRSVKRFYKCVKPFYTFV